MDVLQLKTFLFVNLIIVLDRVVIVGICFPSGIHKAPGLPQPCQSFQYKDLNSISDLHIFTILWVSTWNFDLFYPLFVSARLPGCAPENCSALQLPHRTNSPMVGLSSQLHQISEISILA